MRRKYLLHLCFFVSLYGAFLQPACRFFKSLLCSYNLLVYLAQATLYIKYFHNLFYAISLCMRKSFTFTQSLVFPYKHYFIYGYMLSCNLHDKSLWLFKSLVSNLFSKIFLSYTFNDFLLLLVI